MRTENKTVYYDHKLGERKFFNIIRRPNLFVEKGKIRAISIDLIRVYKPISGNERHKSASISQEKEMKG